MTIHIVSPGLFGPFPAREDLTQIERIPDLEKLLVRSDKEGSAFGYAATLFTLFDMDASAGQNLPTAALSYLADTGKMAEGYVMHADPVFLKPDQDRLLLFNAENISLEEADIEHYVTAFNTHFKSDGLVLEAPNPERWYIHSAKAFDVTTKPKADVVGRNIDFYLPTGNDGQYLHQILNEVQMLFHALPHNIQRELEGELPLSGLWFSGGGSMLLPGRHMFGSVKGADTLTEGLLAHSEKSGEEDLLQLNLSPWNRVINADLFGWQVAMQEFGAELAEIMRSQQDLKLYPCDGSVYLFDSTKKRRFWRRSKALQTYMQQEVY